MDKPADTPPEDAKPRYRYVTVPPAVVRLPVDDVIAALPAGAWVGTEAEKHRPIALPAAEIFEGNFPRIRLRRLADLLPGCIRPPADAPEWVALPTDRVVLAYEPTTRRELIDGQGPPAEEAAATSAEAAPTDEGAAPPPGLHSWKKILKPVLAEPPARVEPPPVPLGERKFSPDAEDRLQRIFMTDEPLTVAGAVQLAAALPGITGCVLRDGDATVGGGAMLSAANVPALLDAAEAMLGKLQDAAGVPLRPAFTVYGEPGPLSFLRQGARSLVVLHRERGFLPGVRETLETLLALVPE